MDYEPDPGVREDDEAASEQYQQDVAEFQMQCILMISMKEMHNAAQSLTATVANLNDLFNTDPEKNYSRVLRDDLDKLKRILENSPMEADHPQCKQAAEVVNQAKLNNPAKPVLHDVKPDFPKDKAVGGYKMAPLAPPTFSGRQRDWQSFWTAFREIHESPKYTDSNKLGYREKHRKMCSCTTKCART